MRKVNDEDVESPDSGCSGKAGSFQGIQKPVPAASVKAGEVGHDGAPSMASSVFVLSDGDNDEERKDKTAGSHPEPNDAVSDVAASIRSQPVSDAANVPATPSTREDGALTGGANPTASSDADLDTKAARNSLLASKK